MKNKYESELRFSVRINGNEHPEKFKEAIIEFGLGLITPETNFITLNYDYTLSHLYYSDRLNFILEVAKLVGPDNCAFPSKKQITEVAERLKDIRDDLLITLELIEQLKK